MRFRTNSCLYIFLSLELTSVASPYPGSSEPASEKRSFYINPAGGMVSNPWPQSMVTWCLEADSDNTDLINLMLVAWTKWVNAVGGTSQSSLSLSYGGICKYDDEGVYLHVTLTSNRNAGTSLGWQGKGHRHVMNFDMDGSWGTGDAAANLAHELGHAFGLLHEHQKWSPWHTDPLNNRPYPLLVFHCENLADYLPDQAPDLCTSLTAASIAGFSALNFLPYPEFTTYSQSSNFDWRSIMLYSTYAGGRIQDGAKLPTLYQYPNLIIFPNLNPSQSDAAAIKQLYPPA